MYGDDLISQHRGGGDYFYLYDGQMSTRQLTDATQVVANEYTYDAFGIVLDQAGIVENNYMYTGEQYDPNAGFYYLRARYYQPNIGRFVTTDPWQGNTFEPLTLHKYLYANANPVMFVDPSGEFSLGELHVVQKIQGVLRSTWYRAASTPIGVYITTRITIFWAQIRQIASNLQIRSITDWVTRTAPRIQPTGQLHHILSNPIMRALKIHPTLSGTYRRADPRFLYRAADHAAHKGYEEWHRLVDQTVVRWLGNHPSTTPENFIKFLNGLYSQSWVAEHIPYVKIVL